MKSRNWTFIHYREHGNQKQLADFLNSANLMFAISPRHREGKHHYHVVLQFSGPTTDKSIIKEIIEPLGDPVFIQKVYSLSGIDKYLTHEDSKNKRKYDRDKIYYSSNWKQPDDDVDCLDNIKYLVNFINENKIYTFYQLVMELLNVGNKRVLDFCVNKAYMVDKLVTSRYISSRGLRTESSDS